MVRDYFEVKAQTYIQFPTKYLWKKFNKFRQNVKIIPTI